MSNVAMLTVAHLERAACVDVRQSSETQVHTHGERQRLHYALSDHARDLGFRDIEVIDDDLGISGAGVHRPGFDALLEAVCKGRVGLVLSIEASRTFQVLSVQEALGCFRSLGPSCPKTAVSL